MDLTRKQFLKYFAGAGAAALGVSALSACDDDSGGKPPDAPPAGDGPPADAPTDAAIDAPPMGNCMMNDPATTIGTNHGHAFAMAITKADVMAGVMKTYNIQGVSDHPHTVTVTVAMFAMLQQNMQVTVASSVDNGHPHTVTIRCV